jgi:cytoskeletal protein RodZ
LDERVVMTSIGETLQNERERQGRKLGELAGELCITQDYLASIENGDLSNLPGLFFYKSFTRQYAALLGVDEALVRQELEAVVAAEPPAPRPEIRRLDPLVEMANRRFVPDIPLGWSVAALAAVLLVCSGFYSWWTRVPVPRITERTVAQTSTVQVPTQPVATMVTASSSLPSPSSIESTLPTVPVLNAAPIVLTLSATERTWLSVSSGGKEIFSGFLQPSESKVLSGLDIATMRVGNAAGIDVNWNGKPVGPLGMRGQVLTIRFTPEDFEIVPPKEQL